MVSVPCLIGLWAAVSYRESTRRYASSEDNREAFRAKLMEQLRFEEEYVVPESAGEAARQATDAIRYAQKQGHRRILVRVTALDDATEFLDDLDGTLASDELPGVPNLADVATPTEDTVLVFAPSDMANTRRLLRGCKTVIVVNPAFQGVLPIEFDDAITAYDCRPFVRRSSMGIPAVKACLLRQHPKPYELFVKYGDEEEYASSATFGSRPPSDAKILEAIQAAIDRRRT